MKLHKHKCFLEIKEYGPVSLPHIGEDTVCGGGGYSNVHECNVRMDVLVLNTQFINIKINTMC